jgi:nucleoside-diphosphate-sugar epimerase
VKVALVGGSGLVGTALSRQLLAEGQDVVVVDQRQPRIACRFERLDLLEPRATTHLLTIVRSHRVDAVVHLAARVDPPRDADERAAMARLHEAGTRTVVDVVAAADVARMVLVSSAVVYGARPDNPVPLPTTAPVRPGADFAYAVDKAAQEAIVRDQLDEARFSVVRPAIVYGGGARSYLTEIIRRARLPWGLRGILPALDGCRPPLQFVHVDDVASIIAAALVGPTGVYHAAPTDWLAYDEVAALAGLRVVDVPSRIVAPILDGLVQVMPSSLRAPSSLFPWLMYPFVVDMRDTITALGITPSWSSAAALAAMLDDDRSRR